MTVQISVTVWAVICFVLLALVLNNLLFKPVLKVMDERKAKIENAKRETEKLQKELMDESEQAAAQREKLIEIEQEKIKAETEKIRLEGKQQLNALRQERLTAVEEYRVVTENEMNECVLSASDEIPSLAVTFLSGMFAE